MVLPAVSLTKPEGGFQFISVKQLCMIWWAYRIKLICLQDLRVWVAAQEIVARRCQLRSGQKPAYTHEELQDLVGKSVNIRRSLQRLHLTRLLIWGSESIQFADHPPSDRDFSAFDAMLAQVKNHERPVPVPRRLLRFIAKGCGSVVTATILGHLLRCLYYRQGRCRADGYCKASWIASVFSVSLRNVKRARQYLEHEVGLLQRTEIPHWVRNRYGQKITINLRWTAPPPRILDNAHPTELSPPPSISITQLSPLESNKKLPLGNKHQKPASSGTPGSLSNLFRQVRATMRTGGNSLTDPESIAERPIPNFSRSSHQITPKILSTPIRTPTLRQVTRQDLKDMDRLLILYEQAIKRKLIGEAEAEKLAFVSLAEHTLSFRPENAGGLFLALLTQKRFSVITQAEEETAQQRLKHCLYAKHCVAVPLRATG